MRQKSRIGLASMILSSILVGGVVLILSIVSGRQLDGFAQRA